MVDIAMEAPLASEGGFAIGDVLGKSLSLFRQDFVRLIMFAAICMLPDLIETLAYPNSSSGSGFTTGNRGWAFALIILQVAAQLMATSAVLARLKGRLASNGEVVREAAERFRAGLGATILQGFGALFGFILLIVPGVMALVMMYLVLPVCVAERVGATASVNRSISLTKSHHWKVLGIFLVANLGGAFIQIVIADLAGVFAGPVASAIAKYAGQVVYLPFAAIVSAVVYLALRTAKEGPAVETLAEVFA